MAGSGVNATGGQGGGWNAALVVPAAWVGLAMMLGVRAIMLSWPLTFETGLPADVVNWIWFGMAVGLANILWGAWLLGQAWRRAPSFSGAFTLWQVANIAAIAVSVVYTSLSGSFVPQPSGLAISAGHIAIGIGMIALVRRAPRAAAAKVDSAGAPPPVLVYVINCVLGAIGGAVALGLVGLLAGSVIADLADISCFEGGCGYFVVAIGLLGLLLGLVAGGGLAVWLTGRRARRSVA